ncbi:MAG TPA: MarR family transcriptional regulator [Polyangia bacterium]|nr:MarR family transcriptional regulator [Polyangia bacterium]
MPAEPTPRAERLANDLRQLLGALARRLRAESADSELSPSEHAVLRRLLEQGPATTAALARAEWVKPQSMGATLAGLEAEAFVVRAPDAADGRCRTVSVTEKGKRLIQAGRAARQSWLARTIETTLDAEEQRTLLAALAALRRLVES